MVRLAASTVAILLALLGAAEASAAERRVPHGFYGVTWDGAVTGAGAEVLEEEWSTMALSGVESARAVFSWLVAQPDRDRPPSFEETDRIVAHAAAHGVRLMPIVLYAPEWARAVPGELASSPAGTEGFTAYLRALVERYGSQGTFWTEHPELPRRPVREWQIWNEPHMIYQWLPHEGWDRAYGELVRAADETLAATDPGARVVLGSLTNESWVFLADLYRNGDVRGRFDAVALNVYTRVPANLVEILARDRGVLNRNGGRGIPIYVTEFGASASAGRIETPEHQHLQTTDRGLARRLTTYYRLLVRNQRRLRIRRAYWYTWASSYDPRTGGIFDFTGLRRFNGAFATPRPAQRAYRASARLHEGCAKDVRGRCR